MRWKKRVVIASFIFCFLSAAVPAHAMMAAGPFRKLGRGAANIVTGWMEIFYEPMKMTEHSGSIAGMTVGVAQGLFLGVGRTLAGAFEVISFPAPNPHGGYGPLIEPEFVTFREADRR